MLCDHTSSSAKDEFSGGEIIVLPGKGGSLALGNLHAILGKEGGRRKAKSGQEYIAIHVPQWRRQHLAMMSTGNLRTIGLSVLVLKVAL